MCLANAYEYNEEGVTSSEPLFSDIAHIEFQKHGLLVTDMLGKGELMNHQIRAIDFLEGTLILEKVKK